MYGGDKEKVSYELETGVCKTEIVPEVILIQYFPAPLWAVKNKTNLTSVSKCLNFVI